MQTSADVYYACETLMHNEFKTNSPFTDASSVL